LVSNTCSLFEEVHHFTVWKHAAGVRQPHRELEMIVKPVRDRQTN
jgi:hypothetical protein